MAETTEQQVERLFESIDGYLSKRLDPLQARIKELDAELAQRDETIKSFERRLSRLSDHCASLESRVKALTREAK